MGKLRSLAALTTKLLLSVCAAAALAMLGLWLWRVRRATVVVDASIRHQTLDGWELTARAWEFNKPEDRYDGSWADYAPELLSRAVNELGIDRLRLEIASGAENPVDYWTAFEHGKIGYREYKQHLYEKVNDDDDPARAAPERFQWSAIDYKVERYVLPMQRLLAARGERLEVNLCYVDFGWTERKGNLQHATQPEEYAELIEQTFQHLREKYGLVPDWLELILEPDNTDAWRGEQIGRAIVAVTDRLARTGLHPKLIAPSTASPHQAGPYIDALTAVPEAASRVHTFSYHRYSPVPALRALPAIARRAREHQARTAMLEYVDGTASDLHEDLALADATAWQQYGLAMSIPPGKVDGAGYAFVVTSAGAPGMRVQLGTHGKRLAQYFKYLRRGAVRLGAHTDNEDRDPLFFRNADGTHVLLIASYWGGKVDVRELPSGSYILTYTTRSGQTGGPVQLKVEPGRAVELEAPAFSSVTLAQTHASPGLEP